MPTSTFINLSAEKKEKILQAAIKEFSARNVREGNLSNIVKDAGIARGSLYQYFKTKDELYIYVFDVLRSRRAEYTKAAFDSYKKAPFLQFFEDFYLRDSEYLLQHPSHISLGQQLYSNAHGVSRGLIQRLQNQYKEIFLIGIEYDKERGEISKKTDTSTLADLCVHFMTDVFIFQTIYTQLSIENIRDHCRKTLYIIENGIHL